MCTINKSAHTKKSANLSYAPHTHIYIYIYIYIYVCVCVCVCVCSVCVCSVRFPKIKVCLKVYACFRSMRV